MERVVKHANNRILLDQSLSDFDVVKRKLASMNAKLYALESTCYFTAYLADTRQKEDHICESTMTKLLALKVAKDVISQSMSIMGSTWLNEDEPYAKLADDIKVIY